MLNEFPENSEILKMVSERNLLDAVLGEFQILPDPGCHIGQDEFVRAFPADFLGDAGEVFGRDK